MAIKKKAAKKPLKKTASKKKRVTLSLEAPGASHVTLCGSFNDWDPANGSMKKDSKGVWKKVLNLDPGKYEYKFLVDSDWITDPTCGETLPNPHGTLNSVLRVK